MESLLVASKVICLPFRSEEHYEECMKDKGAFRQFITIDGGEEMVRNWRLKNPRWGSEDKSIRRRACMRAKKGGETDCLDNGKVGFSPCL